MTTYAEHRWAVFADGDETNIVASAVCQRCGDIRSKIAPTEGGGVRLDLSGECNPPESGDAVSAFGASA